MPHKHWRFHAFNGPDPATSPEYKAYWPVIVDVLGHDCEEDAEMAARLIVMRDNFKLHSVWECASCGVQETMAQSIAQMAKEHA